MMMVVGGPCGGEGPMTTMTTRKKMEEIDAMVLVGSLLWLVASHDSIVIYDHCVEAFRVYSWWNW